MANAVEAYYGRVGGLADLIAERLRAAGRDPSRLKAAELASVDEFHIGGRAATLAVAWRMELGAGSRVLDIGSGLGGPARTLAESHGCHVVGIDLTPAFCEAATALSGWVGLQQRTHFEQGDATALPFDDASFDAVMTIHVAMNIADKVELYAGAHRVLKPGRIFAAYDILQGEGGEVLYPVPWAPEPSISHLATPAEMRRLIGQAGFEIVEEIDRTEEGLAWFRAEIEEAANGASPLARFRPFFGQDGRRISENQLRNLEERRIRTVAFICRG